MGRWFLSAAERGNAATQLDDRATGVAWSEGNSARLVVHGAHYFRRLYDELRALQPGDRIAFTDWRGDADELMIPGGPTVAEQLCEVARRGVEVRGLVWRSHSDIVSFSARENSRLGKQLNEAGAEVLLDQRVRRIGSHHQKLFIIRHKDDPERDVAFVGGIDLCHSRRDDELHRGDLQQQPMDERYGDHAPWHDAAVELHGPVVADLMTCFAERWDDPHPLDRRTPYRMLIQRIDRMPRHPERLPTRFPPPPVAGEHAVQVLRTYGRARHKYPFAPAGERSVARAYTKAFQMARSLIYVEDQYLWSELVAQSIADALKRSPELHVIVVVPRYPDADGAVSGPVNRIGQLRALELLEQAAPDRFAAYDLTSEADVPIYVHAKACIVDDVWMTCGSDNFNRRSWTNDSELTCAILDPARDDRAPTELDGHGDGARRLAREARLELWSEHLARPRDDVDLIDPARGFAIWAEAADALDAWYAGGKVGTRPPGRVRRHRPAPVSRWQRAFAEPAYRLLADPDGRRWRDRRANRF
ncbi:MAG: phospholipase [Frankiaceae bacterium]|nr:phospholipase [Frankiaceae bacterium]